MPLRQCSSCDVHKPLNEYKIKTSGEHSRCCLRCLGVLAQYRLKSDPVKRREYRQAYYRENKSKWKDQRRYSPDLTHADRQRRRRERLRGKQNDPLATEYVTILRGDPCAYCRASCKHIDHIVAISADGDGGWENLTAACARCNSGKREKSLLEWLICR